MLARISIKADPKRPDKVIAASRATEAEEFQESCVPNQQTRAHCDEVQRHANAHHISIQFVLSFEEWWHAQKSHEHAEFAFPDPPPQVRDRSRRLDRGLDVNVAHCVRLHT